MSLNEWLAMTTIQRKKGVSGYMSAKYKGFTLMEMMISMVIISILMAVSAPLITKFSMLKTGINQNVQKCIVNNSSTGWYNTDSAGATILPTADPCKSAVIDIQYDRNKALSSAISIAEHGSSAQQIMAKRILRASCDQGGIGACDYFINTCWLNGSGSAPYCDDATDYTDITYYLHLNRTTYANNGASYIVSQFKILLPKMVTNSSNEKTLLEEAKNDATTAPNANDNIATDLVQPWIYIKACNDGIQDACDYAYANNYNKSCYQVKTNWPQATTQTYKLTYSGGSESISCDMTSIPTAGITGCNAITANLLTNAPDDDCTVGYNNSYNTSCNQVASNWSSAPAGTYNLTTSNTPTYTSSACSAAAPPCVASGIGTVCSDGTVYAGDYNGYHYYTPPVDQGVFTWMTNNNNTNTGVFDADNGSNNTDLLHGFSNPPDIFAPYNAANICYDATDSGYTDWYLPARRELSVLYTNRYVIDNFNDRGYYWSSTESNNMYAVILNFQNNNAAGVNKWNNYYVRCVRQQGAVDATCPNPGDTCADGTKYAGPYLTYYLFTTPFDKGQYTWNNSSTLGTNTNAVDHYYGMPNYTKLIALADGYAPYNAALACKTLNDATAYGYTDWYLPARYEMTNTLFANRDLIGNFAIATYWTSTESTYISAFYYSFVAPSYYNGSSDKTNMYRVRCIRRTQ